MQLGMTMRINGALPKLSMDEVLEAARQAGLERLAQIKYAVLERNGSISIIRAGE